MFPALPIWAWGMVCGLVGLAFVWFGDYKLFERAMTLLIGVMFVIVVGLAILVTPDLGQVVSGLVPRLPEGSAVYTLGLVGGVGGTITMAAYGYWVNAKGWRDASWMTVMRLDNRVAYITTGVFVVAMLIVGAELLFAADIALTEGDRGLLDLDEVLEDRFGPVVSTLFLVGFFATSFSSLLGVWQGVSLLVADFVRTHRNPAGQLSGAVEKSWPYRGYLLWLTFPPMALLFLGRPFALVVAYGAFGAFFMPFLAGTLLWLLNSRRTPQRWRNGWLSNTLLTGAAALFVVLCVNELVGLLG
jgi:Mn2+/Fe2+ NRAMP family transporter